MDMEKDGTSIDPLSASILRVLYRRDTATTDYLRRALDDEMETDDSEEQAEKIKYRAQQKLADLRLVNWRQQGTNEAGKQLPNEFWLSREGREFVEEHADEILHRDDSDSIEDRVAAIERELGVITDGGVDINRVDDLYERVAELEDRVAEVANDRGAGDDEEYPEELVTRGELDSRVEEMAEEVRLNAAEQRGQLRDDIETELQDVRADIRQTDQSVSSIKADYRALSDDIDNVRETLQAWVSRMRPIYRWFYDDSQ